MKIGLTAVSGWICTATKQSYSYTVFVKSEREVGDFVARMGGVGCKVETKEVRS